MDDLGSVRLVLNSTTGAVAQRIDYDEFGNATIVTDQACALSKMCPLFQPFGFAGGMFDYDTGLVRFGARDYDSQAGRWTSKDPLLFAGGTGLYSYAGTDPVNFLDSTGQDRAPAWFSNGGVLGRLAASLYNIANQYAGQAAAAWDNGDYSGAASAGAISSLAAVGGVASEYAPTAVGIAATYQCSRGGPIPADVALEAGEEWLGPGYQEIDEGVYQNGDRRFRLTGVGKNPPYVNFEALDSDGDPTENNHIVVTP